ncbi:hypothetical protein A3D80_01390 [Candidatus Roizmanbacteria bacterium RIFCSPHIGHO2_02_FULL_40_13b]|uniref:Adenylosuccinate synthetase n=1 Tax=Candidatus Roizmanbacteria bacterium RIFCSPHIGHO2_01_FULL_39_24 TaxID=1802032 RepID=A0A1F7GED1_9BACT|nr:MAG: hypothetical protein A2799_03395 [Candidatus Roizmanbacteria bacterium RIFCSPHIGHO2_01_FULL_39_24]OGK26221.1 MAG: hypothetical protein A3D80_01390 [Candidatus Roizmanbacteria bacterium RIFCSPHIGHO2_02_FULL_40_13b]OGK50373.1 MAG: hypothetical protein A3A56_00330 [Candidatus Roizmanbacteria bacterium RIFCSPLOWO2_01_FULL_40_32]OGK56216.1 MAG: hypothetical protein A3H83_01725 [Candidatus Roizmanbacteria bacterium RIFCSPLOWO2_02_FULL_39_8]
MPNPSTESRNYRNQHYAEQISRFLSPWQYIDRDYTDVYIREKIEIGRPELALELFDELSRANTIAIIGTHFGDEGKGRLVDNKLQQLLSIPGVKMAYVVRFQGGSNAGHTVYTEDGTKVALHQLPSSVLEPRAVGIMDQGMVINMEDLKTEIDDVEKIVGDLRGHIILSNDAILNTDLDRAMEVLNKVKSGGKSGGGTARGIGPSYADHYSRLGNTVEELFADDWRETFGRKYDGYTIDFDARGMALESVKVPDLRATRDTGKPVSRPVGTKQEYLNRMEAIRDWYIHRDQGVADDARLRQNTYVIHEKTYGDVSRGIIFEGAQAVGLDAWLGRWPDITASNTTIDGIAAGTGFYRSQDVREKIGVFKATYMSSVGDAHMITRIDLPRESVESTDGFSEDQLYGLDVRDVAKERGTTTDRYRDMCFLDLALMRYNVKMGGIEALAATHLDIAREGRPIKVCTHYVDMQGKYVPYQPGVKYQEGLIPQYIELPGWDGEATQKATSVDELPENAKKFLAFVQLQVGVPIIAATTGPERKHLVEI